MAVVSHRFKLVYFPVPKNACTSVKSCIYRLETGNEFSPYNTASGYVSIHDLYPSVANGGAWRGYYSSYFSFIILRDPLSRFISGYKNRLLHHNAIGKKIPKGALRELKIDPRPDINSFAAQLDAYMSVSPDIKHHFLPQSNFVSRVADKVSRIVMMPEIPALMEDVSRHCGIDAGLEQMQTGGREFEADALSAQSLQAIGEFYKEDISLVRRYCDKSYEFPLLAAASGSKLGTGEVS